MELCLKGLTVWLSRLRSTRNTRSRSRPTCSRPPTAPTRARARTFALTHRAWCVAARVCLQIFLCLDGLLLDAFSASAAGGARSYNMTCKKLTFSIKHTTQPSMQRDTHARWGGGAVSGFAWSFFRIRNDNVSERPQPNLVSVVRTTRALTTMVRSMQVSAAPSVARRTSLRGKASDSPAIITPVPSALQAIAARNIASKHCASMRARDYLFIGGRAFPKDTEDDEGEMPDVEAVIYDPSGQEEFRARCTDGDEFDCDKEYLLSFIAPHKLTEIKRHEGDWYDLNTDPLHEVRKIKAVVDGSSTVKFLGRKHFDDEFDIPSSVLRAEVGDVEVARLIKYGADKFIELTVGAAAEPITGAKGSVSAAAKGDFLP